MQVLWGAASLVHGTLAIAFQSFQDVRCFFETCVAILVFHTCIGGLGSHIAPFLWQLESPRSEMIVSAA